MHPLVTLLEKLLVPLLAKLGNLVVDGGIWPTGELVCVMQLVSGDSLDRVIARYQHVREKLLAMGGDKVLSEVYGGK